jgi:hypothetical protein
MQSELLAVFFSLRIPVYENEIGMDASHPFYDHLPPSVTTIGFQESSGCSTFAKQPVWITFVTLAARTYSRTCLVPELPDCTIKLAVFETWPFAMGTLDRMTALTSIMNSELGISRFRTQDERQTLEYICQIVMIEIGDPYGFEPVTVFQVRRAERNNCLRFRYPVAEISDTSSTFRVRTHPRTRYPAFSRCSTICDPVNPEASVT